jgi:hypothetical protein
MAAAVDDTFGLSQTALQPHHINITKYNAPAIQRAKILVSQHFNEIRTKDPKFIVSFIFNALEGTFDQFLKGNPGGGQIFVWHHGNLLRTKNAVQVFGTQNGSSLPQVLEAVQHQYQQQINYGIQFVLIQKNYAPFVFDLLTSEVFGLITEMSWLSLRFYITYVVEMLKSNNHNIKNAGIIILKTIFIKHIFLHAIFGKHGSLLGHTLLMVAVEKADVIYEGIIRTFTIDNVDFLFHQLPDAIKSIYGATMAQAQEELVNMLKNKNKTLRQENALVQDYVAHLNIAIEGHYIEQKKKVTKGLFGNFLNAVGWGPNTHIGNQTANAIAVQISGQTAMPPPASYRIQPNRSAARAKRKSAKGKSAKVKRKGKSAKVKRKGKSAKVKRKGKSAKAKRKG